MARRNGSKKQVTTPTPPQPLPDPPLLQELSGVFNKLSLIHDVIVVCLEAQQFETPEFETEIIAVLRTHGAQQIRAQLVRLTKIIESLGGTTKLSPAEEEE